jgi:hypothetical protein
MADDGAEGTAMGKLRRTFVDPCWAYKIPFDAKPTAGLATPLSVRKAVLRQQAALAHLPDDFAALFLATAMIETTTLLPTDRDPKKDGGLCTLAPRLGTRMGCAACPPCHQPPR